MTDTTKRNPAKELDLARQMAQWDREYADKELRKLLATAVRRSQDFADDAKRRAEDVLKQHEGRMENSFTTTSERAGWMVDDLRNFIGNQLDLLRNVEKYARQIEQADRVAAIFTNLDETK